MNESTIKCSQRDDLIFRKAAIEWFFRPYSNEESYSNLDVEKALNTIPAVDAVEVVRCDECWFRPKEQTYCTELERHTGDGFYCAFGQRREE